MITTEKIDQWVEEAQQRPESGPLIIRFIANRLRDLSARNEELLNENIALMTEKRVEEYEQRITHLEYQPEVLKRQFSGEISSAVIEPGAKPEVISTSVLVYNSLGRVLRFEMSGAEAPKPTRIARLQGDLSVQEEHTRLLAAPSSEELLYLFTSGRIATGAVSGVPAASPGEEPDWAQAPVPQEPLAGEKLVSILPIARIAVTDYFVQASRRGSVKKIGTNMAQSILSNHYLGAGVRQPPDEAFDLALCAKDDQFVLVSSQGYLVSLDIQQLPYSVVEAIRLEPYDYIMAAFVPSPGRSLLVMTQTGKIVHRTTDSLDASAPQKKKGLSLYSQSRRDAGVRVVGAAAVGEKDWAASLHSDGGLFLHRIETILKAGAIDAHGSVLAFTAGAG